MKLNKLSRDICLGGHWNDRFILGIKYIDYDSDEHIIYLKTDGIYNVYVVEINEGLVNNQYYNTNYYDIDNDDSLYSMHLSPYLEPGDGRIIKEKRERLAYSENGIYTAIMSGRIKAPNNKVLEIKSIRHDTTDLSYFCGGFDAYSNPAGFHELKTFEFEAENFPIAPTSAYRMFLGCESLEKVVIGCQNDSLINVESMFHGCSKLTNVNLRNFKTANITNMFLMFCDCSSLETLDLSTWNTGNVTRVCFMFDGCTNLKNLNLNNWNTTNVTEMDCMFKDCQSLTTLNVSHFNTENVKTLSSMFYNCSSLASLDITNFNTSKVIDMGGMFYGCSSLREIKGLSNLNVPSMVTRMNKMFQGCIGLTSLDLSNFNTTIDTAEEMFEGCYNLKELNISNLKINPTAPSIYNKTNANGIFKGCSSLETLDLSKFTMTYVNAMTETFKDCNSLKTLDLRNLEAFKDNYYYNYNVDDLFYGCDELQELRLDNCHYNTIKRIVPMLPEHTKPDDITHYIYCKQANTIDTSTGNPLIPPTGWTYIYVD